MQAADHNCWHLRKERGRNSDALARSAQKPCPHDPWWLQPPADTEFGVWGCSVTSSLLGLLSASFTRSLSAFTSSSSFSSRGASGSFQVLTFVKHFLRGRKQHEACAQHSDAEKQSFLRNQSRFALRLIQKAFALAKPRSNVFMLRI